MDPQSYGPPFPMQFRPMPGQQSQQYMPGSSAPMQYRPVGQPVLPGQGHPPQFSQPMQQLQSRPLQPGPATPSSQATQMAYPQQNITYTPGSQQFQQAAPQNNHGHGFGGPGAPLSTSYTFATSSFGQPQNTMNIASQFQPVSQTHTAAAGQPWLQSATQALPVIPTQPTGQQSSAPAGLAPVGMQAVNVSNSSQNNSSDWQEFQAGDGRRYYYNKITKQSCWEKPLELMTPLERADASTVWKEFTTAEGKKYYYNKITKESKWSIPDELKLAREHAEKEAIQGSQSETVAPKEGTKLDMVDSPATTFSSTELASTAVTSVNSTTLSASGKASSPLPVSPVVNAPIVSDSVSLSIPVVNSAATTTVGFKNLSPSPTVVPESIGTPVALANSNTAPMVKNSASHDVGNSFDGASAQDIEEAKKGMAVAGKINVTPLEEKTAEDEHVVYASKQEAKQAFKALLESANVEADWNWEQAMRVIINDKRYGALKTLGERKQAFNEYLMQRKKVEAEEKRSRQRKAKEEFTKMLEESKELTSSMRWSKAVTIFEDDPRFKAVERAADREDLFQNFMIDLQKKEKAKAQEEYRQNRLNYRKFLESCGLIKVDTQWRKVQDRLEDDESGSLLDKIDRFKIFEEYIRDLEMEEVEQKKIKQEKIKRVERKNRDEFRGMMQEHVVSGTLTAKTQWRDYCQKVKNSAPYQAVALNLDGSTPKDLFEDVAEELQRQYDEDKSHVKDVIKSEKISFASTWTFEEFNAAIHEGISSQQISDINLQLVFEDLLERVKEKEEKEAKKRQRLVEDFNDKLATFKEITASSNWEECKQLFKESSEYRAIKDENSAKEIFEEYVARLQEKARDKERRREEEKVKKEKEREEKEKRKEKERREKEKEKEREREKEKDKGIERSKKEDGEGENLDVSENYGHKEDKKKEKDRERKHRKRHQSDYSSDKEEREDSNKKSRRYGSEDEKEDSKKSRRHGSEDEREDSKKSRRHDSEDEKEDPKKSRRHGSDRKKSRKHAYTPESDGENRHKRHKRDHRDGSRRNGGYEELEDGELGEDGEIQ